MRGNSELSNSIIKKIKKDKVKNNSEVYTTHLIVILMADMWEKYNENKRYN